MAIPKLRILSAELVDEDGIPSFAIRKWDKASKQYEWAGVPITDGELRIQLKEPVRVAAQPEYWLYRNRIIKEEETDSKPDEYLDALQEALVDASNYHAEGKAQRFAFLLGDPPGGEHAVIDIVRRAMMGIFPKRHSQLARERPNELVLRIKHAVLTEEKELDKLRREVEAFEAYERLDPTRREPIPEHVKMFVWQRDKGRCVKCGCQELLEYDHIIPLARGGSNTERNIQLLCESCNRSKGSSIV